MHLRGIVPRTGTRTRRAGNSRVMHDNRTDAEAIAASLTRPEEFGALFDRHYAAVARYLRRRVGIQLADDLAAETFAEAFRGRASYDGVHRDAAPWLYGIAANRMRSHRRAEVRQLRAYARSGADPVAAPDCAPEPGEPALAAALASLRPQEREVVALYALADLSYEEIARALRVPVGTVRSRLSRARAHLRRALGATAYLPPVLLDEEPIP